MDHRIKNILQCTRRKIYVNFPRWIVEPSYVPVILDTKWGVKIDNREASQFPPRKGYVPKPKVKQDDLKKEKKACKQKVRESVKNDVLSANESTSCKEKQTPTLQRKKERAEAGGQRMNYSQKIILLRQQIKALEGNLEKE